MSNKVNIYLFLLSLLTLFGWAGCRPDLEEYRPSTHTLDELQDLLLQVPEPATATTFTLQSLQQDTALLTAGGVRLTLTTPDELFADANGNAVPCSTCSELVIEVVEVIRKGDVLARGLRTSMSDGTLLESGGQVFLRVRCGATPLQLRKPLKVQIPLPVGQPLQNDLVQGLGQLDGTDFLGWALTTEPAYEANWQTPAGMKSGYELYVETLGWVGAFKPIDEPVTSFCVSLAPPYTAENTIVLLTVPQSKTATPLTADSPDSGTFCYDQAPVGFTVRILVLSKHDGEYWLADRQTEVGTNTTISIDPEARNPATLVTTLKNL